MKFFILTILFLFLISSAFAEIIIVTNNGDSGPGSLRQALLQAAANGEIAPDEIRFNLPGSSRSDLTIQLHSVLPQLSSNLTIDASSQPSPPFGISDARITISPNRSTYIAGEKTGICFSIVQKRNVEIYGLHITGFINLIHNELPPKAPLFAAIVIEGSENITIGAAGKGNLFTDNFYTLYIPGLPNTVFSNLVKVRSNIIGFNEDGLLSSNLGSDIRINCNNFTFGGDAITDRNYMQDALFATGDNFSMQNNYLGVLYNSAMATVNFGGTYITGNDILISKNTVGRFRFEMRNSKNIKMQGNSNAPLGIPYVDFINCENALFGGNQPDEMNIFHLSTFSIPISSVSSKNVTISKNSISCSEFPYKISIPTNIPEIKVITNNNTEYSGTASPNAEVYIYEDNTGCITCNPVQFYTKVVADAFGNWKITGNFLNKRWVSNATLHNNSSEFTQPAADRTIPESSYESAYCGLSNGRIRLSNLRNSIRIEWYNQSNAIVGEGAELINVPPGTYYARVYNGNCYVQTLPLILLNKDLSINSSALTVVQPTCNNANGAIRGLIGVAPDPLIYEWRNEAGDLAGNSADLENAAPGKYTLFVKINGCIQTYGPVTLSDPGFPVLDESAMIVSPATCDEPVGSIKNIEANGYGVLSYTWKNEQQDVVSNTLDLLNMPAGKYTLELKDESTCAAAYSTIIEIPALNTITLSESAVQIQATACSNNTGSIKGITVNGATKYEWFNGNGSLFATTTIPELNNIPAGSYYLKSSNSTCEKISSTFSIPLIPAIAFPAYSVTSTDASCGESNGAIHLNLGTGLQPSALRWTTSGGQPLGNQSSIENLDAGSYLLYLTDINGCENLYNTYTVSRIDPLSINTSSVQLTHDECGLSIGSVQGLQITGGKLPYSYSWENQAGAIVSSNLSADKLIEGLYTFTVTDAALCSETTTFNIINTNKTIPPPYAQNIQICASGTALITAAKNGDGNYRLYENSTDNSFIAENVTGIFPVAVNSNKTFYLALNIGECESTRHPVSVEVSSNGLKIPNHFTPNGDGINDYWSISGMESYPDVLIKVFNRYGAIMYESRGYGTPFNGKRNSTDLPMGTYYYIIELRKNCNPVSGSVTISR